MIRRYNLSIAIFAPGWTHETLTHTEHFFNDFLNRDSTFWSSLWPYFYTHPITDYFETNFYIGLDQQHYNLFSQQQQLSIFPHPKDSTKFITNTTTYPTLKNKCNCIQTNLILKRNSIFLTNDNLKRNAQFIHHLFTCDINLNGDIIIYVVTEFQHLTKLVLNLIVCRESGNFLRVKLHDDTIKETNRSVLEVNPINEQSFIDNLKAKYDFREDNVNIWYVKNIY